MRTIQFTDHLIPYETLLNDIAARVVRFLKDDNDDPEFISQRMAYKMFGRRNIERWRKQGRVEPCKRPGRLEYKTAELRQLQRLKQDYFDI